jgi:hypothetical protein
MPENRWEIARLITGYIGENEEKWTREKIEKGKNERNGQQRGQK